MHCVLHQTELQSLQDAISANGEWNLVEATGEVLDTTNMLWLKGPISVHLNSEIMLLEVGARGHAVVVMPATP